MSSSAEGDLPGERAPAPGSKAAGFGAYLGVVALGLGLGLSACSKPPSMPGAGVDDTEVAPLPATAEGAAEPSPVDTADADADEVLPAYNPEALAARVTAQLAFLDEDELFEDEQGRPLAPKIPAPAEGDAPAPGSVEDDLLAALPGSSGMGMGGGGEGGDPAVVNGNALGLYVPIEEPAAGDSLAHFHQALRDLKAGRDADGKVRLAIYGASHTQADVYPGYMRVYFQERFGDGGPGFIATTKINKWHRYADWSIEQTKGWKVEHAQRSTARKDGLYGLIGVSGSSSSKRDRTKLKPRSAYPRASQYELFFLRQPDGGTAKLYVDGKKLGVVDTDSKTGDYTAGYHPFSLDAETGHELELRVVGDGEVRLFGVAMEREQPGVVVDTLGISGTRAANMLKWNEQVWSDTFSHRQPDLWTMFYGTNEATDENQPISAYRADLREVITRLQRAAPEASCLIIGPGDFPRQVEDGVWVPRPRVAAIIETQRDLAYEMGCGFWDALAFMGGVNSMHTWATAVPQMGSRDHIHFTRRGYVRLGMALVDAMMADFDRE